MQLLVPQAILERLRAELRQGGRYEIGGLLMGEHVADGVFRIVDLSIQRAGGSVACFVRDPAEHKSQLDEFFQRHGRDYARFNYLGEWHSHPLFEPRPSIEDVRTMQSIVDDPAVGVNFLVLLIARLGWRAQLQLSACAFSPDSGPLEVGVGVEWAAERRPRVSLLQRIYRLFKGSA
jgi:integrative and conjugative element protein (TIGR02256 family)